MVLCATIQKATKQNVYGSELPSNVCQVGSVSIPKAESTLSDFRRPESLFTLSAVAFADARPENQYIPFLSAEQRRRLGLPAEWPVRPLFPPFRGTVRFTHEHHPIGIQEMWSEWKAETGYVSDEREEIPQK